MEIVIVIAITFLISWLSLTFERCYKYHQDIKYKMLLANKGEFEQTSLDNMLDELDNPNWLNDEK